jgi:hypothetical protein
VGHLSRASRPELSLLALLLSAVSPALSNPQVLAPETTEQADLGLPPLNWPKSFLSLEDIPQTVYFSSSGARQAPWEWFEENVRKADRIVENYALGVSSEPDVSHFVAAYRFERLCNWASTVYPQRPLELCKKKDRARRIWTYIRQGDRWLPSRKPWLWRFEAEEKTPQSEVKP